MLKPLKLANDVVVLGTIAFATYGLCQFAVETTHVAVDYATQKRANRKNNRNK